MGTENVILMRMARESLKGKWGLAIGTFVVYMLIVAIFQGSNKLFPPSGLISLIIGGPFAVGLSIFSLAISRNQEAKFNQIFQGFNLFWKSLGAYLLMTLFILLWMLLLIIPGIIAAISYSLTFYIIADDNFIGAMEAIDKSKEMMNGYKWKYFCLNLRLLALALLCILTLGIGFLWFIPYAQVVKAKFYEDVKDKTLNTDN